MEILDPLVFWFGALTFLQKFLFTAAVLALLLTPFLLLKAIYRSFFLGRRWFRRKRIPRSVDLKLDRDVAPIAPKRSLPWLPKTPSSEPEYGGDLAKNIEAMKEDAPFKNPQRKVSTSEWQRLSRTGIVRESC